MGKRGGSRIAQALTVRWRTGLGRLRSTSLLNAMARKGGSLPFAGTRSGDKVAPHQIPPDAAIVKLGNAGSRQRAGATRDQKIARARDGVTIEIADVADLMPECTWQPLKLGRGDPACMRISAQYGWHCSWSSLAALQAAACRCWRPSPRSRHIAWDRETRSKSGCSAPMS